MSTITGTHSDLRCFFAQKEIPIFNQEQWDDFRDRYSSTAVDLGKPLDQLPGDFVEEGSGSIWQTTALKVCHVLLMILIFPWGLYVGVRYLVQRLVMILIFPGQSRLLRAFNKTFDIKELNAARQKIQTDLNCTNIQVYRSSSGIKVERALRKPYLVRQIVLGKDGIRYRALMIATAESLATRRWVLQAPGNSASIERCAADYAQWYTHMLKANLLIVQGPGSGDNGGEVPSTDLGEPFDLALSCIERDFRAQQIVLCGFSLGTASIGQAVKKHAFKTSHHTYVVVRQMGFDNIANIAGHLNLNCCCGSYFGRLARVLVEWTGCSFDNVEASRVLQDKQIDEIIVQAGASGESAQEFHDDGIIPAKASLGQALKVQGIARKKIFKNIPYAGHSHKAVAIPTIEALEELGFLSSSIQAEIITDPLDLQARLLEMDQVLLEMAEKIDEELIRKRILLDSQDDAIGESVKEVIIQLEFLIKKNKELILGYKKLILSVKGAAIDESAIIQPLRERCESIKQFISILKNTSRA